MTAEQLEATPLTLPASECVGILRRCSPVVYANEALPHISGRGVVCDPEPGEEEFFEEDGLIPWIAKMSGRDAMQEALGALAPGCGASEGFGYRMDVPNVLSLDLTDETGRWHAEQWFAPHSGTTSVRPPRVRQVHAAGRPVGVAFAGWCCGTGWVDPGQGLSLDRVCPSLAHLDPNDPRLLEDGSRWVDAEALRLVCLHVAGLE